MPNQQTTWKIAAERQSVAFGIHAVQSCLQPVELRHRAACSAGNPDRKFPEYRAAAALYQHQPDAHHNGDAKADRNGQQQLAMRRHMRQDREPYADEHQFGQKLGRHVAQRGSRRVGGIDPVQGNDPGAQHITADLAEGQEFPGSVAHQPPPDAEPVAAMVAAVQQHAPAQAQPSRYAKLRQNIKPEILPLHRGQRPRHAANAEINDQTGDNGHPGQHQAGR